MATIVPTSSDNSGMGVILGILLAIVLAVAAYFFFTQDGGNSSTTNIDLPDVNVSAPATPGAGNGAANPAQ